MIAWTAKWSSINLSSTLRTASPAPPPEGTNPPPPMYWDAGIWFLGGGASDGGAEYELLRK